MRMSLPALISACVLSFSMSVFAEDSAKPDRVNVNEATVQQLDENLKGVGRRIAEEIVRYRESHGPFQSIDDLDKVKYVGGSLLDKNKDKIAFD